MWKGLSRDNPFRVSNGFHWRAAAGGFEGGGLKPTLRHGGGLLPMWKGLSRDNPFRVGNGFHWKAAVPRRLVCRAAVRERWGWVRGWGAGFLDQAVWDGKGPAVVRAC